MDFNEPEFNDKTLTDSDMKHGTFSVAEDNATDEIQADIDHQTSRESLEFPY